MKIIPPNKDYVKEISRLMLTELEKPNPLFPQKMILQFREHAKEENILNELENPNLIAFVAIHNGVLVGFIVGYKEDSKTSMIQYINGGNIKNKKLLLKIFIDECKKKGIVSIKTDTFEFMENNKVFKEAGFVLIKKEKITNNLKMLWYKLDLNLS